MHSCCPRLKSINRNYYANVLNNGADPRCICTQYNETYDHLVSGFQTLAQNEYVNSQNRAA